MSNRRLGFIACAVSLIGFAGLASAPRTHAATTCDPAAVATATSNVEAACPCAGKTSPSGDVTPWKNHGQYTSCVTRARNTAAKQLGLSKSCLHTTTSCAARSTCGKKAGFVVCRIPDVCSDPTPDGVPTGTCSDDPTIVCDTAADCPVLHCSVKSSSDLCTASGGDSALGSCCD